MSPEGFARRDLGLSLWDGVFFSLMVGLGETYLPAFALALGHGEVLAGLVASVPMLIGGVVQLVAPRAVHALGSHRRWVVMLAGLQAAVFAPLCWAAWTGRLDAVWLFAAIGIFCSALGRTSAVAALYAYGLVFMLGTGTLAIYLIGVSMQAEAAVRPLLALAAPVVTAEIGWMAMWLVDTMIVGRLSAEAIGAVSVGGGIFFAVAIFGMGILLGLDFLVGHAHGSGRMADAHAGLVAGVHASLVATVILTAVSAVIVALLPSTSIQPAIVGDA